MYEIIYLSIYHFIHTQNHTFTYSVSISSVIHIIGMNTDNDNSSPNDCHDDNRDHCLPLSVLFSSNQHDYNAKTIDQDPFDNESLRYMTKMNAKRAFLKRYGDSSFYLIYDFEKCKGNRRKEDVILNVLLKMGVSSYLFRNLFGIGHSRLARISSNTNRISDVISDDCREDISAFLKLAPNYRYVPCSHREFILFQHPIHNFTDACRLFQSATGKSINVNTFQKNLQKYGGNKTSFMCRRPKYFPMCGECESQECFVVKTKPITISDDISGDIIYTHEQVEEDNLLNSESNRADENIDLSIQHVSLDQPVEIDIIDSVSSPIDIVSNQFYQTCSFVQQNETVISECDPHHVEINTNQSLQPVNLDQPVKVDIIDSVSSPIDIVSNQFNQTCSFVQQNETVISECDPHHVEINTNQSLQPVNLAYQYGQMDIIDSQSDPIDIVCNPLNQTCSIVQQNETVILDCDPNQVKMNTNQSLQSVNLVDECGQMDIIDAEANQSIRMFDNQSHSEIQESISYQFHCDQIAYKARQSFDTPPALTRDKMIIPRIHHQESRMDNSLTTTQPSIKRFLVLKDNLPIKKRKKEKLKIYNTNQKQAPHDYFCSNGF